ncbi:MAG: hypothetical protein M1381_03750 [Deltaproteobacteria bacterium]|nr:hypothetical protein [Deltaproteobacteria bacterium]MCL5792501.1 hypothetical protein [Deltaproteobacteria bacterium]
MVEGKDSDSLVGETNPAAGIWHVEHDIEPLPESLGSKKSIFPSLIFSGVCGLSIGIGTGYGLKLSKLIAKELAGLKIDNKNRQTTVNKKVENMLKMLRK